MRYRYNPYCSCSRCRTHEYMGPAVIITVGVLFLLAQATSTHWLNFGHTWPALLIVMGLVSFLQHSAPANGHIQREYGAAPPAAVPYAARPAQPASVVTPPPVQPSANPPTPSNPPTGNNTEVHNG